MKVWTLEDLDNWRLPLRGKVESPIEPFLYGLTYPNRLKCPKCGLKMPNVKLAETFDGPPDAFGNHWRLFQWDCPQGHYIWKEWV
ncbi:hypothetical protein LCGC14_1282520 [marine sediment metagenome]|uniref:Uncharacterized protein n=1 Tax=marine sediment metagenome TaxID=412755 RepID=A0A0F9LFV7_9ZZZZ